MRANPGRNFFLRLRYYIVHRGGGACLPVTDLKKIDRLISMTYTDNIIFSKDGGGESMSVPDRSIDPRLLSAAKEEFLKKGYEKSSLADICKTAGVTTGALYKRYKGKEDLFSALVTDTIHDMEEYVSDIEAADLTDYTDRKLYDSFSMLPEANRRWLRFLYERRVGFTLLIRCSSGSRYERFHQDWTEKMNVLEYKFYQEAKRRSLITKEISVEELQALTYSVWSLFYEPFFLGFTWEQIERHSEAINQFIDWHSVLGMKEPK